MPGGWDSSYPLCRAARHRTSTGHLVDGGRGKEGSMLDWENSQRGQGLLEYGLVIILVGVLVIVVIAVLGPSTGNLFSDAMTVF